jgi:predicted PurR-regulated permease PerM
MKLEVILSILLAIAIIVIGFLVSFSTNLLKNKQILHQQINELQLELKLYKLHCKDEKLQKDIQNDFDNLRNAVDFFSNDGSDSLQR